MVHWQDIWPFCANKSTLQKTFLLHFETEGAQVGEPLTTVVTMCCACGFGTNLELLLCLDLLLRFRGRTMTFPLRCYLLPAPKFLGQRHSARQKRESRVHCNRSTVQQFTHRKIAGNLRFLTAAPRLYAWTTLYAPPIKATDH